MTGQKRLYALLQSDKYDIKYFDALDIFVNTSETPPEFLCTFIVYLALNWHLKAGRLCFILKIPPGNASLISEYFDTGGGNGGYDYRRKEPKDHETLLVTAPHRNPFLARSRAVAP